MVNGDTYIYYIYYILYITTQISNYDYKYYILIMVFPIDGESLYSCSCVYIYIIIYPD